MPFPLPTKVDDEPIQTIRLSDIIETRDGPGAVYLPMWLSSFINGGIAEVEKLDYYQNRYLFIGKNKGVNFMALSKWAESFTVVQDFPRLAALRIEKRLISSATMYPDDEYGEFFETLVKKSFGAEYPNAVKEETFWIKKTVNQENDTESPDGIASPAVIYDFFVFVSIDKATMQTVIRGMMTDSLAVVTPTRAQNAAINRLRQIFFEGF